MKRRKDDHEEDDGAGLGVPPPDLRPGQEDMEHRLATTPLGFEVAIAEKLEERGVYDLSRLEARKPEIYRAAIKCIKSGVSAGTTADLLSLDIRTVNPLVERLERENAIPPYKERIVWQLRSVVTIAVDRLMDEAKRGNLSPLDVAILIDKIELLSGGVTSRTERVVSEEEQESEAYFRQARQQLAASSGMVLEAELLGQSGDGVNALPVRRLGITGDNRTSLKPI